MANEMLPYLIDALQGRKLTATYPQPIGMSAGMPDYGYGNRYQEPSVTDPVRPKGIGYFGQVARPDGNGFSGEIGIGTDDYGEIPTMVPTLTPQQLAKLLTMDMSEKMPPDIVSQARSHAALRRLNGQSPWAGINDAPVRLPEASDPLGVWR